MGAMKRCGLTVGASLAGAQRRRALPRGAPTKPGTLRASTLVEVIVASVIFLTIFAISLHTITRLAVNPAEGEAFAEADSQILSCFRELADGRHEEGEYTRSYNRGEILITIASYRDYDELQEITISTAVNRKRIEYKHIIERLND